MELWRNPRGNYRIPFRGLGADGANLDTEVLEAPIRRIIQGREGGREISLDETYRVMGWLDDDGPADGEPVPRRSARRSRAA